MAAPAERLAAERVTLDDMRFLACLEQWEKPGRWLSITRITKVEVEVE